jgi:hypothetical protein
MRDDPMPRPKPKGPTVHFQLKLYGDDAERWQKIWDAAKKRNPYIDQTRLNRLLLGLDADPGIITEKDRIYFRGQTPDADLLGTTKPSKAHLKEVSPKTKRQ